MKVIFLQKTTRLGNVEYQLNKIINLKNAKQQNTKNNNQDR